jgi:hypothetical protein
MFVLGTTEFDLPKERTTELYDSGRVPAEGFLAREQSSALVAQAGV